MAVLQCYNIRARSLSCMVAQLDTSYERDDRTVRWYLNGTEYALKTIDAYVSAGGYVTFEGLSPETSYLIFAVITYTDEGIAHTVTLNTTVTTLSARPSYFYWAIPKVQGEPFRLLADEWNALGMSVNAVRAYRGLAEVTFTVAVSGQPFTAQQFNEVRGAIVGMGAGSEIPAAVRSHPVTAAALNGIVDALNSIK